jgi:hypothetical protein
VCKKKKITKPKLVCTCALFVCVSIEGRVGEGKKVEGGR